MTLFCSQMKLVSEKNLATLNSWHGGNSEVLTQSCNMNGEVLKYAPTISAIYCSVAVKGRLHLRHTVRQTVRHGACVALPA